MHFSLPSRVEGLTRWFERRNQRPLIGFTLGPYYPLPRYPRGVRDIASGPVSADDIVVSRFLDDTEALYQLHEQAGGDLIWAATPFWGVPWVEAALGCGVEADQGSGSMRSVPPPGFAERPSVPRYSADNPWVARMLEFIPALERLSNGRFPVGVTLMRGISDLLSALYGAQDFVLALHDDPQRVAACIDELVEFWIAFGRDLLDHLPLFHGGTGGYMYSLWFPGRNIWLQEDAVALLSPQLFERYIYPADARIAAAFEHVAVHLHPTRHIPSARFAEGAAAVVELHIDHDGPRAEQLARHHRTILDRKPLLIWGDVTLTDLDFILSELPSAGLAVNLVVESPEQAHAVWQHASRHAEASHVFDSCA